MRFALTRSSKSVENTKCPFFLKPLLLKKGVTFSSVFFLREFCGYTTLVSFLDISTLYLKEEEKSLPAKSLSHLSMSLFPISRKSDEYEFFVD